MVLRLFIALVASKGLFLCSEEMMALVRACIEYTAVLVVYNFITVTMKSWQELEIISRLSSISKQVQKLKFSRIAFGS